MSVSADKLGAVSLTASKNLVEALKSAARVTLPRSSLSALKCVRLSFAGDDIIIEATDLEVYYRQTVFIPDLAANEPFVVMVTRDAIRAMKAPVEVSFSTASYTIGGIKATPSEHPDSFPRFPSLTTEHHELAVGLNYFADLAACAVSASQFEVRPILTAVCHRGPSLVATDALRLCLAEQDAAWPAEVSVPARHADLLAKAFGRSGAYMLYDRSYAQYKGNGFDITLRVVDGNYPDVSRIIPTSETTSITIPDIQPWLDACDRALTVHKQAPKGGRNENLPAHLVISPAGVILSARSGDQEFSATLPGEVSGNQLTIACNAPYLKDALLQIGDGAVIGFNGNKHPFLFTSAPDKAYRRKALVSPVLPKQ